MSQLPRRRDLLKLSVLAVGALPTACYRQTVEPQPLSDEDSAKYFPQSVMSGDPRCERDPDSGVDSASIVLWVRVEDASRPGEDLPLSLSMALDEGMTKPVTLQADADFLFTTAASDHCLGVRVAGLDPATTYYYRFSYQAYDGIAWSRIGRTRTAPAVDSAAPLKFAVVCCQDYVGKYFHVPQHISEQDVDFVLHLGDYIYETTGDPSFQSSSDERNIVFSAPEEALELGGGSYLAAQSLSNYRDLYKQYRSDPGLQALHERHPVIAIWDDHEFSDDSHGDVATYQDGHADETSPDRRASADQAWFEFMPVDFSVPPTAKLDKLGEFPDNFSIYRSFVFGQHLELVVTDLRRFRPDHLVPEDAPPGAVFLSADEVAKNFETPPTDLVPYVDIEAFADGAYHKVLADNAAALAITADSLTGNFSAVWINDALAALTDVKVPEPIDLTDATLERGYAYHSLGKVQQFSRFGSRYVVAVGPFEALAQKLWQQTKHKSEMLMGQAQRDWFLQTVHDSSCTFKIWASEVAFQARRIDLTGFDAAPADLRTVLSISAEDWDGFPNERRALLKELSNAGNVLILSGDLHCYFAGTPFVDGDEATRVVELTTGSATSNTWLDSIAKSLGQDSSVPMNVQALVQLLPELLSDTTRRPNPHLAYQ
ncbi:MAG TPA: alkaline phosphatase D family protein, partial [Polyangiaceae bacterium]|nr:alkaline phosphatase D family protein [Polyangiaceae bacterium]